APALHHLERTVLPEHHRRLFGVLAELLPIGRRNRGYESIDIGHRFTPEVCGQVVSGAAVSNFITSMIACARPAAFGAAAGPRQSVPASASCWHAHWVQAGTKPISECSLQFSAVQWRARAVYLVFSPSASNVMTAV